MNGIAEASVRRVKGGTSALLHQSGLDYKYWPEAMRCWCACHNFYDANQEGPFAYCTPYKAKFSEDVWKLHQEIVDLPFGARCEYLPQSKKPKSNGRHLARKPLEEFPLATS